MRKSGSRTAVHVALFRALESARNSDRLFSDPYAQLFLTPGYRLVARAAKLRPVGRGLERYIDRRWSGGPRGSAVMRTRLIDDWVIGAGVGQVVLLGAGFDSRAHRLPALASAVVFEVDHPATQAVKQRVLAERRVGSHADVRFVPVDLLWDDLGTALDAAGFDHGVRTVVVWEGVTNYLTAEAVDATLRYLGRTLSPGSEVIFTYVDRSVLDGTGDFAGVDTWQGAVRAAGEPWTFGFDPVELPAYLAERRLRLVDDDSTSDAAKRYGRREPTAAFYRVVRASVTDGSEAEGTDAEGE